MLTILFTVLMIYIMWKILIFAVKAGWGIFKVIVSLMLPALLIGLFIIGLVYFVIPIMIVVAIVYFATRSQT